MQYKKLMALALAMGMLLAQPDAAQAAKKDKQPAVNTRQTQKVSAEKNKVVVKDKAKDKNKDKAKEKNKQKTKQSSVQTQPSVKTEPAKTTAVKQPTNTSQLTSQDGKVYFAGTELPRDYKKISIYGEAVATKAQAVALIKNNNPNVRLSCTVEELVDLYWEEAGRENVRPDIALAQSLLETGSYRYGGDVQHHQNNFCGLGTTGGGVRGAAFKTPQLGVRAHIQHLLAYTQKQRPSTEIVDPRYELAHNIRVERGVVDTWSGLNGTWAMGSLYCEKIMVQYQRMLAQEGAEEKTVQLTPAAPAKKKSMRERIDALLHEDK